MRHQVVQAQAVVRNDKVHRLRVTMVSICQVDCMVKQPVHDFFAGAKGCIVYEGAFQICQVLHDRPCFRQPTVMSRACCQII